MINNLLLATRVISRRGRWPGQAQIVGGASLTRRQAAGGPPPRWPGQARIGAGLPVPPRGVWELLIATLAPRRA